MTLVLLPGLDGSGKLFANFIAALGDGRQVLVIDYDCGGPQDYESLFRQTLARLPQKGDFILIAESFSGPIAAMIGAANIHNLKMIIFVATFLEGFRPLMFWAARHAGTLRRIRAPSFILKNIFFDAETPEDVLEAFRNIIKRLPAAVLEARLRAVESLKAGGIRIEKPCVYIGARGDRLVPARCAGPFQRAAPHIQVLQVDGPHFLLQARAGRCAEVIEKLIRNNLDGL